MKWDFTPYDLQSWNEAKSRILFVAAEPNGNNPNSGKPDMGDWFRTATPLNKYHSNKLFHNRCKIILEGALKGENIVNPFKNFRFMDLKATQGEAESSEKEMSDYVHTNLCEVLRYFNSEDRQFGVAPSILIVVGKNAQNVFSNTVKPLLLEKKITKLQHVYMPHPSAQTVVNDLLKNASFEIPQKLSPLTEQPYKWFCRGRKQNGWIKLKNC